MKKYIGVTLLLLAAVTVNAQDYIKGHVKEKGSGRRLSDVFIKDNNNKQITVTDEKGNYTIRAASGHTLVFSSPGYIPDTLYLINNQPKFVELQSEPMTIGEVSVRSSRINFDPRAEYPEIYRKSKIYPLSLSSIFSQESRNARKLKKYFEHEEQEQYVDNTYTKLLVSSIVPLKGRDLDDFMGMSRPSYEFLKQNSGGELTLYVNDQYKKFIALSPQQRASFGLSTQ
jgi:plasmid maintenance system killer protein